MEQITLYQSGNILGIGREDGAPLSPTIRYALETPLTYTYRKKLYGLDKTDPITGHKREMVFEERKLFKYDKHNRFCCGIGFINKLKAVLDSLKATYNFVDLDPPHPRKKRFEPSWDNVADLRFKARQDEALAQVACNDRGIICAPPAFGKSYLIMMICKLFPHAKIHVVTKRKDIVQKTVRFLTTHLPNVGQVGGGKKRAGRITVFTADSLHISDGDADILLADEAHELMADSYAEELAKYRRTRCFALTATPTGRKDGTDARMASFFGEVIFNMTYQEAVDLGVVAPIAVEWLEIAQPNNPCEGKVDVAKKRWGIWRNSYRNKIIADRAKQFVDEQVLILVETIEHALYLRKELPNYSLCYSENGISDDDLDFYRRCKLMKPDEQPLTAEEREDLRIRFEKGELKKVIATGVWSTGVDFVDLQVLIRADGQDSEIMDFQAPGRVCRLSSAKEFGLVVDCMDRFDSSLLRKAKNRNKNYLNKGWTTVRKLVLTRAGNNGTSTKS